MSSVLKNYRKIYTTPGADPSIPPRVAILENNEYKVTYYEIVTGTSGTLSVPSQATINSNEFGLSGNAILSKIDANNKPTYQSPLTSLGAVVTTSLNVLTGAWVASGVYTDASVAVIYSIRIKAIYYSNLSYSNIIETVNLDITKTSQLINDGDNGISHFISLEDLPSSLILYPTNVASGIGTYTKLVNSITDPSYNTVAVNIPTGAIVASNQFIAGLITSAGLIVGNPGQFNITTIGNIQKLSGSGNAEFYFEIYKRTSGGVETLITTSGNTLPVVNSGYVEFSASALWNDGTWLITDYIVMKFYGNHIHGGSNPTYQFQFGGITPVRTLVPLPLVSSNVVPYTGAIANVDLGTNNISANNFFDGFTSVTASGTLITLTISSTPSYLVTGSGGQTIKMPNATTLPNGAIYYFNNNQSSGAILVNNNSNTLIKSVASGSLMVLELTDNSTAAGSWDAHFQAPSNVIWSTNTFDYAGSITSATWNGVSIADNRIASSATWNAKQDALSGTGFVKSTAGVISYDTNTYLTTSSAASTYVPYTGGTANVDLGLFYLKSKGLLINGSTETITLSTSATSPGGALGSLGMLMGNYDTTNNKAVLRSVLWGTGFKPLYLQGEEFRFSTGLGSVTEKMVINTNGNVAIGTTTASAKLDVFGGAADTRIRITGTSTTATAVFAGIEIVNNIGLSGCFFQNPSTNTTQYGGANSFNMINILNAPLTFGTNNLVNFKINGTASSGSSTTFTLTNQNNIGQTASANIPSLNYIGGARQWATGNITTQNEIVWGTTSYSFVDASVITNAYGNVFNAPTAGTNCTITNNWAAQFNGNVDLGSFKINSPLHESTGTLTLNANGGNVVLKSYGATIFTYTTNGFSATPVAASSGFSVTFSLTKPNNTNQTASSNIPGWNYLGGSRQWATGAIANQTENVWGAVTYSFVGTSTITNAYGNVFNAPIAGTNCIITNNFSALFNNPISLTQTVTTETAVQTRTVTIVINGVTYKLLAA